MEGTENLPIGVKNRLRALRKGRDLTQEGLGTLLGVSRQTVNAIEVGRHDPSLALAFAIARVFGRPIEEIFTPAEGGAPGAPARTSRAKRRPRR